jgi:hypothetical protein
VLDAHPINEAAVAATTEAMLTWARDCITDPRRPYGIDQLTLAVAAPNPVPHRSLPPASASSARSSSTRMAASPTV